MQVSFKVNLGSQDATAIGLDFRQCLVGRTVECEASSGKWLVSKGIATDVTPEPVKEVPVSVPVPEVVAVKFPDGRAGMVVDEPASAVAEVVPATEPEAEPQIENTTDAPQQSGKRKK